MSDATVSFSPTGPEETVLEDPSREQSQALAQALATPESDRRKHVAAVAGSNPRYMDAWAQLGRLGRDPVESYAYFRVGYHRGLDALRGAGWRGSGPVLWAHESNRGFLRCLEGLRASADELGEVDEADRCAQFLQQCDPNLPESLS